MWDRDQKDLAATLSRMEMESRQRCNFNQIEARQKMREWISQDRRFDSLDPERVAERVAHCRSAGAVFDIDDPSLRKSPPRNRY
jgi:hypothetical protein